ncbi:MAG: hypothetical protein KDA80_03550 [Planctomycetaceae bacterium]|nr:hypothetical protein [Planctomycetaceae bacterium]
MKTPASPTDPPQDCRLYLPDAENWQVDVKRNWDRSYCFSKLPGQDYYHLILGGELFIKNGDEVYCLQCALRLGILSQDRLFWQNRSKTDKKPLA